MAKSKKRKLRGVNVELTSFLDIDELKAIGGDRYTIKAMSPETEVPKCIECGGPTENHGRYDKLLLDIVSVDRKKQFARLHYYFYKYRCLNKMPGHEYCNVLFQKQMNFVSSDNAKITRRYEDEIMRLAMYESLSNVRDDMKEYVVDGHENDLISKPAMSKVIKRWVEHRDESRIFGAPSALVLYTYTFYGKDYVLVADISVNNTCRIIEVIPSVSEVQIKSFFQKIDIGGVRVVLVDCNPILYETALDLFSEEKVLVDVDALRRVLRNEFKSFVNEHLKHYQKDLRKAFLLGRDEQNAINLEKQLKMYRLQNKDTKFDKVYSNYIEMYMLLKNHRDIPDLQRWADALDEKDSKIFGLTKLFLNTYSLAFARFYKIYIEDGFSLYDQMYMLSKTIENYFPISTDEVFRARILYSDFDVNIDSKWQGIELQKLRTIIDDMITTGGLEKHER